MSQPGFAERLPKPWLFLAIVLLVAAALRLPLLAADAPLELQRGFIYDEGEWLKNARQFVLFGHWQLDDYNPALYVAPVYSVGLALVFAVAGVGQAQAHLLNALAGVGTALLVYWILRREAGAKAGLVGGLIQATAFMAVLYDRAGFIEPVQVMLMTAAIGSAIRSLSRPWFGGLAGALIVMALFTKISSAIGGLIIVALYLIEARRFEPGGGRSRRWAPFGWFAVVAVMVTVIGLVLFVLPELPTVLRESANASAGILDAGSRSIRTIRTLILPPILGLEVNVFFARNLGLFAVAALALACRVTGGAKTRWSTIEIAGWLWLIAGLGFLSVQHYQPHRRFLFLQPALAILGGWYAVKGVSWPDRSLLAGRSAVLRLAGAGLILGGTIGFFLGLPLGESVINLAGRIGIELSLSGSRTLIFGLGAVIFTAGLAILRHRLPEARHLVPVPAIVAVSMAIGGWQHIRHLIRSTYTLRESGRFLGELTRNWPKEEQRVFGGESNTLAVETTLFAFSAQLASPDPFTRFNPTLVTLTAHGAAPLPSQWRSPGFSHGYSRCTILKILPFVNDSLPRFRIGLYLRDDIVERCPEGSQNDY